MNFDQINAYLLYHDETKHFSNLLKNQKILITGGTGLLGSWIIDFIFYFDLLLNLEIQVTILSRKSEQEVLANFPIQYRNRLTIITGDIRNFHFPSQLEFDYLIHGSGLPQSVAYEERPFEMSDVIINGTSHLLSKIGKLKIKKIIFLSSGAAYGKQSPSLDYLSEELNSAPSTLSDGSLYGEAKRMAELLCILAGKENEVEVKIARCFTFTGPRIPLNQHFAIGNFIKNVIENKDIEIKGDIRTVRSYLYSTDLSFWIWKILLEGKDKEIYNVGSDESISIIGLAELIKEFSKYKGKIIYNKNLESDSYGRYLPSIEKAKTDLSLKIKIGLNESILRTLEFFKIIPKTLLNNAI